MGLFDLWASRKASPTRTAIVRQTTPGQPVWTPRDYGSLAREGYQQNVWVYACITEITRAAKAVPWTLRQRSGAKREVDDHPLLDLWDRPNEFQGRGALLEAMLGHLLLAGNMYLESVGPKRGPPKELYALRPDRMKVKPDAKGYPRQYEYRVGDATITYDRPLILHTKLFNPTNDWYGLSPIEAAAKSVDTHNEGLAWNVSLLQNKAQPGGAWVTEGTLDDTQFERMKAQVDDEYAGSENAGRTLLLEGGVDWKQMGLNAQQLDWIEGLDHAATQIAAAFGVPGELVGLKNATHENRGEARKTLYTEVVLPILDHVLDDLNNWLVPKFDERLELVYDADQIDALGEDKDNLWTRTNEAWSSGILTRNEARVALGYGELPGGEAFVEATRQPREPVRRREYRAFNLASEEAKAAHWKAFNDLQNRWERTVRERARQVFEREREGTLETIKASTNAGGIADAVNALLERSEWADELTAVNVATAEAFGQQVKESLPKAALGFEAKQGPDVFGVTFDETISALTSRAAESAKQISDTTKTMIRLGLAQGVDAGESIPKLAERIDRLFLEQIIPNRSETIARTEVIRASNYGSHQAAKGTGLNLKRQWLSTRDGRARAAHLAADGQTVGMEEPFIVDGERLQFPGDPRASGDNSINCRCTETYEVMD